MDTLSELIRQSFRKRFLSPEQLREHMQLCSRLVRTGGIRTLTRRRSLGELAEVVAAVEVDCADFR